MNIELKKQVEDVVEVLKELNEGKLEEDEAKQFFKDITPLEISLAEQRLLKEGMDPKELRKYCEVHLKAMESQKEDLYNRLPSGNPIKIAIAEHDEILKFLDRLEEIAESLQAGEPIEEYSESILHVARHLVEAEKHHEREEEVLFPRLEKWGVTGPPMIMREDHEKLWPQKIRLKELAQKANEETGLEGKEKEEIIKIGLSLVTDLRDHIFKENNILYPTFVEHVETDREWNEIRDEFDQIGYCCFTPQDLRKS